MGWTRGLAHLVNVPEALVFGALAADAGAGHDGGVLPQIAGPFDSALDYRFPRRHHGELREAIDHVRFLGREMIGRRRSTLTSAPVAKPQVETFDVGDRPDAAAAFAQRRFELVAIAPQSADDSDTGDDDSAHQDAAGAVSPGASP